MTYVTRRAPQLETITLRGLRFQAYHWAGRADRTPLVLIHGWGDTGATWQFLVDELPAERACLAIDLRGFGRTQWADGGYWFPDYLADLEALLDMLAGGMVDGSCGAWSRPRSPGSPSLDPRIGPRIDAALRGSSQPTFDIVGHSMGANVAMLYAGVRPHRVRRLVNLEGFGLARTSAEEAPARYAAWLDDLKRDAGFAIYDSFEQFSMVLAKRNPRTPAQRLKYVARCWAREREDGRIELRADPAHKRVNPVLYQREQAQACWRAIAARVLVVSGEVSGVARSMADQITDEHWRAMLRDVRTAVLPGAGHMLHHEQPHELAELIEAFLAEA